MELFLKILSDFAPSAPLVIAVLLLHKSCRRLKKISVEKVEIETYEDEQV